MMYIKKKKNWQEFVYSQLYFIYIIVNGFDHIP